jgi:predicted phage baseplate assembly protein
MSITQLRTSVPYVDSVTNLEPATGGQNIEDWDLLRERGARYLRHRGRAVTLEDYEDLAKLASSIVAKTKCYPNRDLVVDPAGQSCRPGVVSLIVVPRSVDRKPLPDLSLLRRVRNFLRECRMPDTEVIILAPEYVRVTVEAVVVAANSDAGASIVVQCEQALGKYLHPLTGGPAGGGWEFGRRPYESDVYALLESIRGLEYVRSLSILVKEERPGLLESEMFLICAGEQSIRLGF